MDSQRTSQVVTFRSPPRILIPKLVESRDAWKLKAGQRKKKLKAAQIHCRDLSVSRELWKKRALAAEENTHALHKQLLQAQSQLQQAKTTIAQLELEQKKTPASHRS